MTVVKLYAGAGGWDEGMRGLGLGPVVGIDVWMDACRTAMAAGHPRICADVATYPTAPFAGRITGLTASPPCQAWSTAGKRLAEVDRARVHELVDRFAAGDPTADDAWREDGWADPDSHHAAQPVRWIRDLRPEWVAFEQVPPVLPLWKHIGRVLAGWGYSTWVGSLLAADYGVPQTRTRAVLIASRVGRVKPPTPTHYDQRRGDAMFGEPWVSMAEALGMDGIDRPARTVCGDRAPRWAYGPGASYATGWTMVSNQQSQTAAGLVPQVRGIDEPAQTITGQARSNRWQLRNNTQGNAATRGLDEPAATLFFGARLNNVSWVSDRPAATVCADDRIAAPGHRDREGGERQFGPEAVRITIQEAAVLQSFRPDYPWRGNKTSQFGQCGNAVPPGLARVVIAAAAGIDLAVPA